MRISDWSSDVCSSDLEGITCLLIDLKAPGVTIRPIITIDGRHIFYQEFFDDVRVPVADRVGEEGQGWKVAKYLLGHERSNGPFIRSGERRAGKGWVSTGSTRWVPTP